MKVILLFSALIIPVIFTYSQTEEKSSIPPPEMVLIQGGTFQMGSIDDLNDEKPVHPVTLNNFYIGKFEITVGQFGQFILETGYKTDADKGGGSLIEIGGIWDKKPGVNWKCDSEGNVRPENEFNYPVVHVSWNDARQYCNWLSNKTGKEYRLPTEAEWEFAAGNGAKHTVYSWGDGQPYGKNGGNVADESSIEIFGPSWIWPDYNDGYVYTAPVGSFNPNELGLYDMTGNVGEWCTDIYGAKYYKSSPREDPRGPSEGNYRVIRGGSWRLNPIAEKVTYRDRGDPSYRYQGTGFRVAMPE